MRNFQSYQNVLAQQTEKKALTMENYSSTLFQIIKFQSNFKEITKNEEGKKPEGKTNYVLLHDV